MSIRTSANNNIHSHFASMQNQSNGLVIASQTSANEELEFYKTSRLLFD